MYNYLLIKHYVASGNTWSSTATDLVNAYDKNCKVSVGDSNDSTTFKLQLNNATPYSLLNTEDKVEVYNLVNTNLASSSNLVYSGIVKQLNGVLSKGSILDVSCNSFNEMVTQGIVFVDVSNVNVMEFLEAALNSTQNFNLGSKFNVTWDASNPTVKEDGSAFPKLNSGSTVKEYYKSLSKVISDYLVPANTGDGNYYWWISNDNKFKVAKNKNTTSSSLTLTEGVDFVSLKEVVDSSEVVNFVIVRCGVSPNGDGVTARDNNPISVNKHGLRFKYIVDMNIISNLLAKEKQSNPSSFNATDLFPSSYPYTITTWTDTGSSPSQIVSNASSWVEKVKREARRLGKIRAGELINNLSDGIDKYTFSMNPNNNLGLGVKVRLVVPSLGVNDDFEVTDLLYDEMGLQVTVKEVVR